MTQKDQFDKDGFIIVSDIDLKRSLMYLKLAIQEVENKALPMSEAYDTIAQTSELLNLVSNRDLNYRIAFLLGSHTPLYTFTPRLRIDPPFDNRRTYGWHQEIFYSIPKSKFLQTWGPVIYDTTKENGTIEVCVGSHKEGIAKQTWITEGGKADQIIVDPEIVAKYEQRTIEMKVGEVLIFYSHLFHRSGQNTSGKTRYSFVCQYHDLTNTDFKAPQIQFNYNGLTPKEYYDRN